MRMKPDWLNDSSVTQVVVVAEGSYIRHIVVLPPIEPRRVARTNHDTAAISGEKNKSRIRQSVTRRYYVIKRRLPKSERRKAMRICL